MPDYALGRGVDHDERSRGFRTTLTLPATLKHVDWDDDAPITDQATGSDALLPNSKGLDFYHQATLIPVLRIRVAGDAVAELVHRVPTMAQPLVIRVGCERAVLHAGS